MAGGTRGSVGRDVGESEGGKEGGSVGEFHLDVGDDLVPVALPAVNLHGVVVSCRALLRVLGNSMLDDGLGGRRGGSLDVQVKNQNARIDTLGNTLGEAELPAASMGGGGFADNVEILTAAGLDVAPRFPVMRAGTVAGGVFWERQGIFGGVGGGAGGGERGKAQAKSEEASDFVHRFDEVAVGLAADSPCGQG